MKSPLIATLVLLTGVIATSHHSQAAPPKLPFVAPDEAGVATSITSQIDGAVQQAIDENLFPGCVILVARHGSIIHLRAYGNRRIRPAPEAMTIDSIFDVASITKPVVTASSVMVLADQGKLHLDDPVAKFLPEYAGPRTGRMTLRHLLTHQSGLPHLYDPDPATQQLAGQPGEKFIYSCAGLIIAGKVVERISGTTLAEFAQKHLFTPLGMRDSTLGPVSSHSLTRTVPTSTRERDEILGVVNDHQSYCLNGIAGNAGLFSTAEDLALFGQMLLNKGEFHGTRVLSEDAVTAMTTPDRLTTGQWRGVGWDMKSNSPNRSQNYSDHAFGHGGWTGTSFWIDPDPQLIVILLSSRNNPVPQGDANRLAVYGLAGRIGDLVIGAIEQK